MKKKNIILLSVLLAAILCSVAVMMPGCADQPQQGTYLDNNLNALIGPQPEPLEVLDAAFLEGKSFSTDPPIPVNAIFSREAGYEQLHDDMLSMISTFVGVHHPDEPGFFYSSVPVYHFRATTGEVAACADIYVFSQSMECLGCASFIASDSDGSISVFFSGSNDIENGDYLREHPSEKFVFIYNGKCNLLLNADNEVYPTEIYKHVDYDYDFSVSGDYCGAIPFEMLSVCYNEIINSLVWTAL